MKNRGQALETRLTQPGLRRLVLFAYPQQHLAGSDGAYSGTPRFNRPWLLRRILTDFRSVAICLCCIPLTGCATFGSAPVYGEIPECERLIPASLKADVPGVPIPDSEEAEPWMQAFIGQTGQLEKANERPDAIDHIYKNCLVLHRRALQRAQRGFFARLFG